MSRIARADRAPEEQDPKELIERFLKSGHYTPFDRAVKAEAKARSLQPEEKKAPAPEKDDHPKSRHLPIPDYDEHTPKEILSKLDFLSRAQVRTLLAHEQKHQRRRELVRAMQQRLKNSVAVTTE